MSIATSLVIHHPDESRSRDRLIWFKGEFVPAHAAKVSVLSPTAQFGLNVFEGIRGYWNSRTSQLLLFRLDDHLRRLFESCKLMGLKCPFGFDDLKEQITETALVNGYREDIAIRVTLFVDEEGSWSSCAPVNMFIAPIAKPRSNLSTIVGKSACVSTWKRIDDRAFPPRVKAGANYINSRYAHLEAKRNGYDLPLLLGSNEKVSEGAGACLFIVRNGTLITPSVSNSILESITRDTILMIAKEEGIQTNEREVDRTELYLAEEAFLCGSAAEITPVTSIDRMPVGDEEVGTITSRLFESYLDIVSNHSAIFPNWRTPVYGKGSEFTLC